jgi:type II secretory pathway component PulF
VRLHLHQRALFWRKLETFLRVGISLADALPMVQKQSDDPWERDYLQCLRHRLEMGLPFSDAAEGLPPTERELLRAAEATGELSNTLTSLADAAEKMQALRAQIKAALTYPTLVACVCTSLWIFLVSFVLPRFEKLFTSMHLEGGLPPLTRGVLGFSQFLAEGGWGLVLLVLGGGLWILLRAPLKFWKRLPVTGALRRNACAAEFFSALGLLADHGVELDRAVESALGVSGVPTAVAHTLAARITEGVPLEEALRAAELFSGEELQILALAQRTGSLAVSASRLGALGRERYEIKLKKTLGMLEPALIIIMATTLAVMLGALFAPLLPLVNHLGEV